MGGGSDQHDTHNTTLWDLHLCVYCFLTPALSSPASHQSSLLVVRVPGVRSKRAGQAPSAQSAQGFQTFFFLSSRLRRDGDAGTAACGRLEPPPSIRRVLISQKPDRELMGLQVFLSFPVTSLSPK